MNPVEKVLKSEVKALNKRLSELKAKRDKVRVENTSLTTQIDQVQSQKQTFLSALAELGYTT